MRNSARKLKELDTHPLAEIYPPMDDDSFAALKTNIEAQGLIHPVVTLDGFILDGRHRYRACRELGFWPETLEYEGETDDESLAEYVQGENDCRRHYEAGQKACIASERVKWFEGRARERKAEGGRKGKPGAKDSVEPILSLPQDNSTRSVNQSAAAVGAGVSATNTMLKISKEAPEVFALTKAGKTNVADAKRLAALDEQPRAAAVSLVTQGKSVRDAIAEVVPAPVFAVEIDEEPIDWDPLEEADNFSDRVQAEVDRWGSRSKKELLRMFEWWVVKLTKMEADGE